MEPIVSVNLLFILGFLYQKTHNPFVPSVPHPFKQSSKIK